MKVDFNYIKIKSVFFLSFLFLSVFFVLSGCQEPYKLGFDLILPENTDFTANIRKVSVVLGDKVSQTEILLKLDSQRIYRHRNH